MTSDTTPLSPLRKGIAGVQYLFVAFGATVLVPLLVGLDPSTALFSAGIGTLLFHLATKGKVPIFLGSSFAFIAPIISATQLYGLSGALFGCIGVSAVYLVMSLLIRLFGLRFISRLFPPVVIGPIIMLIGLSLSGAAVKMAATNWPLATISLATAIIVTLYGRGIAKLIPIFLGIIVGYLADLLFFEVDLKPIAEAAWWSLPQITLPQTFSLQPILFMIPVAIAPVIEHIGDVYVVNSVAGKNFVKDPGLHRTMLGDGIACLFASLVGGPPVTTYSEVTGAMSLTKITDPVVFRIAAVTGILFSLIGKVSALLRSIDQAILGAQAQNIQLHYDLGSQLYQKDQPTRPALTTTVELFRPDRWGNTFFFVDMNYQNEGISSAYWEIAREFKLAHSPLALHLEYNGGLTNQFSFNNAYLAGFTYAWNQSDYQAGFTFTPMYKYLARQERPHSFQLTSTWYVHMAGGKLSFMGFADFWGDRQIGTGDNNLIFLSEPQLWVNLNKFAGVSPRFNLSIGTEWEISHNFAVDKKTIINPTLALKWTF